MSRDRGPGTDSSRAVAWEPEAAARSRRLLRLADARGVIAGIAIDHRDSLRVMVERRGQSDDVDLHWLKVILARALAPSATALMLDAELGAIALAKGAVPAAVGLIMPLEAQSHDADESHRTSLLDDFSPAAALRYGADACKILLPFRADDATQAAHQTAVVTSALTACHRLGMPLVVEAIVYQRPGETTTAFAGSYGDLIRAAVERLRPLGVDLFKLPFPVLDTPSTPEVAAAAACRALADACGHTPWVVLGAGVATRTFLEQIRLAGTAGASGFLAGRGIWGPALDVDRVDIERTASTDCLADLTRCRRAAERYAKPLALHRIS